ncbi:glutamine--fructose-6-phosphate transaminase (isomerizing) [Xylocopilactobacillus apicola]|uniref:Glutamine--fructose-6-phosphate aminotransferase [isomerizing] n=1 Tax=Xylocopilactobacillus apicola TaxID=2932184 RepID=A0AAU9DZ90_9LACO|nr:glutamine--fructose-6-phosphate transaminase (isomerizing) [Xylocopilactobacillus apicola]BDR59583.1 glutamine--fructose-6-phosphate aminotransferase [isomerizing] [Xylocopilactobacillus apicola]
MCGIVGVIGREDTTEILLNGLEKLEYRGYDSAGIFVTSEHGEGHLVKEKGKIADLRAAVGSEVQGTLGIGHTRWATHGIPSDHNAHPQVSANGRFYLVHNGVLENYEELKAKYLSNVTFTSETDTEVAVQLVEYLVDQEGLDVLAAFRKMVSMMKGSYAFLMIDQTQPDQLYVAKNKSPLLIGLADGFNVVCSDSLAMLSLTHEFDELHDGETAIVTSDHVEIFDPNYQVVERKPYKVSLDADAVDKGTYPFFMLKEIDEQPAVIRRLVSTYLGERDDYRFDPQLIAKMAEADQIYIVAAGTSYHAGLAAKQIVEEVAKMPVAVELASEFGYHLPILSKRPFFVFLSQSGETADSRQVLVKMKELGYPSLTITNVDRSTLSREADFTVLLNAGPEIAVASTKAYTAQITVMALLAKALGQKLGTDDGKIDLRSELSLAANAMQTIVDNKEAIEGYAKEFFETTPKAFYIGRGQDYFASLEAALKLKEISYIQAEGFAAGELKHGTISLIENGTPVIALITDQATAGLTRGNIKEVEARGAKTLKIVSENLAESADQLVLPAIASVLSPLLTVIPAQLLAYYATIQRGYNVDQPRNLAKSVTVE